VVLHDLNFFAIVEFVAHDVAPLICELERLDWDPSLLRVFSRVPLVCARQPLTCVPSVVFVGGADNERSISQYQLGKLIDPALPENVLLVESATFIRAQSSSVDEPLGRLVKDVAGLDAVAAEQMNYGRVVQLLVLVVEALESLD